MTSGERRRCMFLLRRCQQGDNTAFEPLTAAIAHHFQHLIWGWGSVDPAYDRDDIEAQFRFGIWQAIRRVDGRGDPLYHLAWRGQRQVVSLLCAIKTRRHGTEAWVEQYGERSVGTIPEGWDVPDPAPEADPSYLLELRQEQAAAHRRVTRILARVELRPRQHDVVEWMLQDEDPGGPGANKRLAGCLGVTEQRASVLRRQVNELLSGAT